jgi:signal transduction histidine kinase
MTKWATRLLRLPSLRALLGLWICSGIGLAAASALLHFSLEHCQGGACQPRSYIEGAEGGTGIRVRFLSSSGSDLSNGGIRTNLISTARKGIGTSSRPMPVLLGRAEDYLCAVEVPIRGLGRFLGPVFWALSFISVLCCAVEAYVTLRLRRIEAAVRLFGQGQLSVRASPGSNDAVGRLGEAFNQMAERTAALVESQRRLRADTVHELRAPLTRLLLAVPRARRGLPRALDRIEIEASRVTDLAEQLLCVSRAEDAPAPPELEAVNLGCLLTEIVDRCEIEAGVRNCGIELILQAPGVVAGDVELLSRAVENVVRNALQHSPKSSQVTLRCGGTANGTSIEIRDRGPGVPPQMLQDIFRPFFRASAGPAPASGGAGLGLAITQRAIALHGGTIRAENCAPGLLVTIELPRC